MQKINSLKWRADCAEIYAEYDVYSVSQGQEQSVRSGKVNGPYGKRSNLVLDEVTKVLELPSKGSFLDFGCGSGVSSMAISRKLSNWTIDGFDLDQRMESELFSISGFNKLYVGAVCDIDNRYDLIMLTHVLEHIPNPIETMKELARLLKPNGAIVVQVPNRLENLYDLLVADHLIHFDVNSLSNVFRKAGLCIKEVATDWVMKELSLVAVSNDGGGKLHDRKDAVNVVDPSEQVDKLHSTAKSLKQLGTNLSIGFFGTSLVAVWMAQELGRNPDFYVDEDTAKIGRSLNGIKILAPSEVPKDAFVIPAMADGLAKIVAERYSAKGLNMVFPNNLSAESALRADLNMSSGDQKVDRG